MEPEPSHDGRRNPNVAALLGERAASLGSRLAIVDDTRGRVRRLTFAELEQAVGDFAATLRAHGLGPGDRVLVFVPMSAELYVVLLGVLHVGAAAVFVDAWADRRRLNLAVETAAPQAFVGSRKGQLLRLLSPAIRRLPHHLVAAGLTGGGRRSPVPSRDGPVQVAEDAPALVTLTTGSTGRPRAAARSHGFLWAQHRALAGLMRPRPDDVDLTTLPIFVLNNLALGVTSVLPRVDPRRPVGFDPAAVYRQIRAEGVTTLGGSPAFCERLALWATGKGLRLPLRALFTGGAAVTPTLARLLVRGVSGEATVVYGSTEAEPIAGIPMPELLERSDALGTGAGVCAGKPAPEIDVRLIRAFEGPVRLGDDGWLPWEVAPGEVGEVVVAGEHVHTGYLNDPEADERSKIHDDARIWHRTGDAARQDPQGRLWLQGRVAERLCVGDQTYWTLPVELGALSVDGIRHAAYVAMPGAPGQPARGVLCVELHGRRLTAQTRTELIAAAHGAPISDIVALRRIPRDPRHASKTDTIRLRMLLRKP